MAVWVSPIQHSNPVMTPVSTRPNSLELTPEVEGTSEEAARAVRATLSPRLRLSCSARGSAILIVCFRSRSHAQSSTS